MHEKLVTGLSRHQISTRIARGEIVKQARGIHTWGEVDAQELAKILDQEWPDAVLDGETALRQYLGLQLKFPLQLASRKQHAGGVNVQVRRLSKLEWWYVNGGRCVAPLTALGSASEEAGRRFLNRYYAGFDGKRRLSQDLAGTKYMSKQTRALIDSVAIGADSAPEREIITALKQARLRVESNYEIGGYRWDIAVKKHKVAVEIDGYGYHSSDKMEAFLKDHWKPNDAAARGWTVFRYSGSCVKHHKDYVVRQILGQCEGTPFLPPPLWKWHKLFRPGGWRG